MSMPTVNSTHKYNIYILYYILYILSDDLYNNKIMIIIIY